VVGLIQTQYVLSDRDRLLRAVSMFALRILKNYSYFKCLRFCHIKCIPVTFWLSIDISTSMSAVVCFAIIVALTSV
jgi:hypothetical protein